MNTFPELEFNLQQNIIRFCKQVFLLSKQINIRIRTIIIMFKNNKVYIGDRYGGLTKCKFRPCYYDADENTNTDEMYKYINNKDNIQCLHDCNQEIYKLGRRLKSFIILYHHSDKVINICQNRMTGTLDKIGIFNEIKIDLLL